MTSLNLKKGNSRVFLTAFMSQLIIMDMFMLAPLVTRPLLPLKPFVAGGSVRIVAALGMKVSC